MLCGCAQGNGYRCRLDARQLTVLHLGRQHDSSLGYIWKCVRKGKLVALILANTVRIPYQCRTRRCDVQAAGPGGHILCSNILQKEDSSLPTRAILYVARS